VFVLTGSYLRSLDVKCRISLPKAIRDVFHDQYEHEREINRSAADKAAGETSLDTTKQDTAKQDTAKQDTAKQDTAKQDTAKQDTTSDAADSRVVFLTPGTDGSLDLYSPGEFHELVQRIHARSSASEDGRAFRRLFYAQAQRIEVDRQGRFRIPSELMELANLAREVMLVGVGDHMELWNPESWRSYLAEKQLHFDEIAEKTLERPASQH
jgi:MraZ protein